MAHQRRGFLTMTAVYWVIILSILAIVEWIVIDQRLSPIRSRWDPWLTRMGYLAPITFVAALGHGLYLELVNRYRHRKGRNFIRGLMMPITAAVCGVVLMLIQAVPDALKAMTASVFGAGSAMEYLTVPLGLAVLSTAAAFVLGAGGGGLRGRR